MAQITFEIIRTNGYVITPGQPEEAEDVTIVVLASTDPLNPSIIPPGTYTFTVTDPTQFGQYQLGVTYSVSFAQIAAAAVATQSSIAKPTAGAGEVLTPVVDPAEAEAAPETETVITNPLATSAPLPPATPPVIGMANSSASSESSATPTQP